MKNRYKNMELNSTFHRYKSSLFITGILILTGIISCTPEDNLTLEGSKSRTVTFSVSIPYNTLPETRGMTNTQEKQVNHIDVLVFEPGGDFLYQVYTQDIQTKGNETTFTLPLVEGTSDLIILSNARSIINQCYPDGIPEGETRERLSATLQVEQEAGWNINTSIPMWGEQRQVKIEEGCHITGIKLHRMICKINVSVTTNVFKLSEVYICNPSTKGQLIPKAGSWNEQEGKAASESLADDWVRSDKILEYKNKVSANACKNEIYTFETAAGNPDNLNDNTYIILGGTYNGSTTYYRIDMATEEGTYLPLLRNHRYEITLKKINAPGASTIDLASQQKPANITYGIEIFDESEMGYYVWDNHHFLSAEVKEMTVFHEGGEFSIDVETDYPEGWTAYASGSSSSESTVDWLRLTTVSGTTPGKTALTFMVDSSSSAATGYIHISAGPLKGVVNIKKRKGPSNLGPSIDYVGAFWRNNQIGERLISIPNSHNSWSGEWRAIVMEGKEWIVLDTKKSEDPGITWNESTENPADMNIPSNDQKYFVSGESKEIFGTCKSGGKIQFRIGLTEKNPSTTPRYGTIRVEYRNYDYYTILYLRQGEEADYLFRPEDPAPDGWRLGTPDKPRPLAVKISPYNLTSPEYLDGSKTGGPNIANHSQLEVRGGVFTEYPTQAGAYFAWSNNTSNIRYAYHPAHVKNLEEFEGYERNDDKKYWDQLQGDLEQETCPSGYTRPSGGPTNRSMNESEWNKLYDIEQSLFLNAIYGGRYPNSMMNAYNFTMGYYADGFFDRREIVDPPSPRYSSELSVVNPTSHKVAYIGYLYFNPYNKASLFFPNAGKLDQYGIFSSGRLNMFWLKSRSDYGNVWALMTEEPGHSVRIRVAHKGGGSSIRCIKEE